MEQQHPNYESETFGFINSAFGEAGNYTMGQDDVSKSNLMIPDFSSPPAITNNDYNDPSPIYSLPTEPISNYSQYQELPTEENKIVNTDPSESAQLDMKSDAMVDEIEQVNKSPQATVQNNEENSQEEETKVTETVDNATSEITQESKLDECTENHETQQTEVKPVIKRDPSGKRRRRIVLLNDEDDSQDEEDELKKELLEKFSDTEQPQEKSNDAESFADNESNNESDKEASQLIVNKNFLKAKNLLKSAVVIQDPDAKKKKKKKQRVLESDDSEDDHMIGTSVDDIGLINEEEENHSFENDGEANIFIDNIVIEGNPFEMSQSDSENLPAQDLENLEAIVKSEKVEEETNTESAEKVEESIETKSDENQEQTDENPKTEKDETKAEEDENSLDKIQPMDDDDDFFKFNDSTDDEEKPVTNEEYFGTPDKQGIPSKRGRKRGPKPGSRRQNNPKSQKVVKRGSKYEKDFVDDSDSSSSYSESISSSGSSSSESSREKISKARPKQSVIKKPQIIVQTKSYTITKVPIQTQPVRKDRFFDESRNIPNDVYFGDVKVPLHVLHTRWSTDDKKKIPRPQGSGLNRNIQRPVPPQVASKSAPHSSSFKVQHEEETKLTVMKEFMKIAGLKINYPKLFNGVKSTDHKCVLLRRILNQKGLEGEPTLVKCKKLRRDLQAKKEIAELDKSVILPVEGRTRRSKRGLKSKDSEESLGMSNNETETTTVQPEVLQTLTKIKSVIDSDSD